MGRAVSVLAHIRALMRAQEKRLEQRFKATEKAITKAEAAVDKRLAGMNEFRDALRDQAHDFLPRSEYSLARESNLDRFSKIESRLDTLAGNATGKSQSWALIVGVAVVTATVVSILGFVFLHSGPKP